ncbi:uncharacterized protein CLAFUR5_20137 [Fulvia fulva]|uniref:uncharacterized protein n=1 Tax=Passalora fulva TaxID=5499 RepID=UPI0028529012|nr:uncharacterized protein CLAFUR5_20137 [Fulvia fulva]WMI38775.1 hypothetical protein CLAFUR5_20137 [Fulvia fulva]
MHTNSPPEHCSHFSTFFTTNCLTQVRSMREPVLHGRSAAISDLKERLNYWHLDEPRIISRTTSDDGMTVILEMANKLSILGDVIDPFPETVVARFDEGGCIESLKGYNCQSPVVYIVQQKTGKGPYTEAELGMDNDLKYNIRRSEGEGCCA